MLAACRTLSRESGDTAVLRSTRRISDFSDRAAQQKSLGTDSDKGDKFDIPVVPFPSLGISFETTIFKYSGLFFDINGMYAGKYLGYMNWKTGLRIYPWHWTGLELSYRHLYAEALWDEDLVKTDFHGFNMTFLLRF